VGGLTYAGDSLWYQNDDGSWRRWNQRDATWESVEGPPPRPNTQDALPTVWRSTTPPSSIGSLS
jgi:hypothetical protein